MSDKIFIDTNVLVYCYSSTELLKKSVAYGLVQTESAWISTQVLQELSNTLRKKFGKSWSEIQKTLEEVSLNFNIYTNSPENVWYATRIADRYGYSFYDSLILSSCMAIEFRALYTEDMQNGQIIDDSLTIINPFLVP